MEVTDIESSWQLEVAIFYILLLKRGKSFILLDNFFLKNFSPSLIFMNSPPSFPPLYFVKRGNVVNIECFTPPLCVAERGTGVSTFGEEGKRGFRILDKTL